MGGNEVGVIINLVSYGILCHYGTFADDVSYEKVNEYCHG